MGADKKPAAACLLAGALGMAGLMLAGRRQEALIFFLLGGAAGAALLYLPIQRAAEARKRRESELTAEYAAMVTRLCLYMTAGLTLRRSWEHMLQDYREERERGGPRQEVYEEMLITGRELLGGIYEDQAYGRFGRRCGTAEYLRLGGLLETYVQQGNKELLKLLEQEAGNSLSVELAGVKKKGEKTAALLLLPIILLFILTLLLVLVPAFMQLGASV